ncbi:hypothetical protein FRB94_010392 [Tulasnella sp. JGI-2019a]|nr:hypothetical protein FRB94_010392 [Tulasnella sp. JGI-2019a]KAG9000172.1 hypothetical protein FRB93_012847 [Tulasnella sp. JGI-2019a]
MQVTADLFTWTSNINAVVRCAPDESFHVSASTVFTASTIPGRATWNANRYFIPGFAIPGSTTREIETFNFLSGQLLQPAGIDLLLTLRNNMGPPGTTGVVTVAATLDRDLSPYNPPPINCTANPLTPVLATLGFNNMTFTNNTVATQIFQTLFFNATANFMHAMLATVRLDFGNKCPNFLTNTSLIDETFYPTPNLTEGQYNHFQSNEFVPRSFYDILHSDNIYLYNSFGLTLPLYDVDYVYINAPYLCHLTEPKARLELFVSVVVAVFGLWSSASVIMMIVVPWFLAYNKSWTEHLANRERLEAKQSSLDDFVVDPEARA